MCSAHTAELLYTQNINQAHCQTYTHHRSWKEENCTKSQSRNLRLLILHVTKFNCFSSIKPESFRTHQCRSPKYAGFCEIARKTNKHLFVGSADIDNTSDLLRRKSLLRRVVCISCASSRLFLRIIFALSAGSFTHPLSCLSLCN